MRTNTTLAFMSAAIACASLSSVFAFAGAQKSSGGNPLNGTSWQLVKFQGPDERTFAPDDKSKYTITFGINGRVTARVDCNRASKSEEHTSELQSPLHLVSR